MKKPCKDVDGYIGAFPEEIRKKLVQIRMIIRKAAPEAEENISYGMPAYKMNDKPLVYFAAYKKHIGFYATPAGHEKFAAELSKFRHGKGSVQFPLDKLIPYELIKRVVQFRVMENPVKKNQ